VNRYTLNSYKFIRNSCLAAVVIATVACTPIEAHHGYLPDDEAIERLKPGVHDSSSVSQLFGAPITIANFKGETWFYMRRHTERFAFFEEEVVSQDVLAVRFDARGIVESMKRYSFADGKYVEFSEDKTPTRGKELTFVQQIFGNLGRFTGGPVQ
jgi:outer membrane protein assembly factor BamE (lipoprotein component of BamABCDE complex)